MLIISPMIYIGLLIIVLLPILSIERRLVTLASREEVLSVVVVLILSISRVLVALVIIGIGSIRFLVVLLVLYIKVVSIIVEVGFVSIGFLVVLVIVKFLLYMKVVLVIIGIGLLGIGLLVVVVAGLSAIGVIGVGSGVGFLEVLIVLSSIMFLLLTEVIFIGRDMIAYTEPLIPLCLDIVVFLDLD